MVLTVLIIHVCVDKIDYCNSPQDIKTTIAHIIINTGKYEHKTLIILESLH